MKKRNLFLIGPNLDLLKQLTQPCTVKRHLHHADPQSHMIPHGCLMGSRFLPVLTGMGLDSLGIGGDLEGPPTHLLSFGQGCRRTNVGKTLHDSKNSKDKLKEGGEERGRERESAAPAMPVTYNIQPEHRERLKSLYWDKLGQVTVQQLALVARLVSQAEVDRTPDAKAAMDKE